MCASFCLSVCLSFLPFTYLSVRAIPLPLFPSTVCSTDLINQNHIQSTSSFLAVSRNSTPPPPCSIITFFINYYISLITSLSSVLLFLYLIVFLTIFTPLFLAIKRLRRFVEECSQRIEQIPSSGNPRVAV